MNDHEQRLWRRLLEYAGTWAEVREVPDGLELRLDDGRSITVVMTPSDWDDHLGLIYGSDDPSVAGLRRAVEGMPVGMPYLVLDTHDWVPSATREAPEEEMPDGPGQWVTVDPDGTVHRFADWPDD